MSFPRILQGQPVCLVTWRISAGKPRAGGVVGERCEDGSGVRGVVRCWDTF